MTIHDLRKAITTTHFETHDNGCSIYYIFNAAHRSLHIGNVELYQELISMDSLDENATAEAFSEYYISQWDAINLVIRHEYAQHIESDIINSDLGKSISNLIK